MPQTNIQINTGFNAQGSNQAQQSMIGLSKTAQKAEQDTLKLAQAYARLDAAQKNPAAGAQRLRNALDNATIVTQQHGIAIRTQIAQLDNQAARLTRSTTLAQQFGSAMQSQLLNIVGPAALATAALGGVSQAIQAGKDALVLKETLNGLRAISGSTLVYADAVATAKRQQILFGGSLQENIEGLQGLVITSRDTGAKLQDLVDLSQRLTVKSPEQGAAGSRIAIQEAFSEGNITSLARRFEIPRARIEALKDASIPAAEKVKVLSDYLDSIGISSEAVAGKVDKTAQSYREFAAALEAARLKLGEVAAEQGVGIAGNATGALTGITQLVTAYQQLTQNAGAFGQTVGAILTPFNTYNNMLIKGWTGAIQYAGGLVGVQDATQAATMGAGAYDAAVQAATASILASTDALSKEAKQKLEDKIETAQLAQQQAQLEVDSIRAANGLLGAGDQALILAQKYGIAAEQAQFLIRQQQTLSNATALADQRVGERDPSNRLTAAENENFGKLRRAREQDDAQEAKRAADKAAQEAKQRADKARQESERLADAQLQNRLINAKDNAAKIRILNEQLAKTTDPVERQQIKNQIDQEQIAAQKAQISGANSLASAADKRLRTEESIYDAIQKQRDAMLDIEELTIRDRQQDREDAKDKRIAERIINSPLASEDLKARARDKLALIDVQDRKRAAEIAAKQTTVGGTITDSGRLLQSVPGGGATAPASGAAAPQISTPQAASPSAGAGAMLNVNVIIDGNTAWSGMAPYAWEDFMRGVRQVAVGQGAQ